MYLHCAKMSLSELIDYSTAQASRTLLLATLLKSARANNSAFHLMSTPCEAYNSTKKSRFMSPMKTCCFPKTSNESSACIIQRVIIGSFQWQGGTCSVAQKIFPRSSLSAFNGCGCPVGLGTKLSKNKSQPLPPLRNLSLPE